MATANDSRESLRAQLRRAQREAEELGDEFSGIATDVREVVRTELELAKAEMREQVQLLTRSAMWGGIALVCAMLMLVFVALTAMFALSTALPMWVSALLVTLALGGLAALGGALAYARIKQITVVPKRALRAFKEDVAWAGSELKSSATWSNGAQPSARG
jgi:uncharacterized membrane protein YqjE